MHEDRRDVFVDIELLHEILDERTRFRFALGLSIRLGHDIEFPTRQLTGETNVLTTATDRLRELLLGYGNVHAVRVFIDHDRDHLSR